MSVTGIQSSNSFSSSALQDRFEKVQQEFKQLGQDLQSGNLAQAKTDFTALQQNAPQPPAGFSDHNSSNAVSQAIAQLARDLNGGNSSTAASTTASTQTPATTCLLYTSDAADE